MTAPLITVHLRAADGATFDRQLPAIPTRPTVRIASIRACAVATVSQWDGSKWVQQT